MDWHGEPHWQFMQDKLQRVAAERKAERLSVHSEAHRLWWSMIKRQRRIERMDGRRKRR